MDNGKQGFLSCTEFFQKSYGSVGRAMPYETQIWWAMPTLRVFQKSNRSPKYVGTIKSNCVKKSKQDSNSFPPADCSLPPALSQR